MSLPASTAGGQFAIFAIDRSLGFARAPLKQFRNYCGLIKIARSGFPWEKTTKRPVAPRISCDAALSRTIMCDFLHGKSQVVPRFHQPLQEIRVRSTPIAKLLWRQRKARQRRDGCGWLEERTSVVPDSVTPSFARAKGLQQQANATGQRLRESPPPVNMILPARLEGKGQRPYFWSELIPKVHALPGSRVRDDTRQYESSSKAGNGDPGLQVDISTREAPLDAVFWLCIRARL